MRRPATSAEAPARRPGSPLRGRTAFPAIVADRCLAARLRSASPKASTAHIRASVSSIIICRRTICRRPGGCWSPETLGREVAPNLLASAGDRLGGIVADLHDAVAPVDVNDQRVESARLGIVEHRVAHDDNQVA